MTMCGCNKTTLATSKHLYVPEEGSPQEYNSEIEARAAMVRAGGKGEVRTK